MEKRRGSSLQEKELISSLYAIRDALISLVIKSTGIEGETKQVKSLQTDKEIGEGRKIVIKVRWSFIWRNGAKLHFVFFFQHPHSQLP